MPKKYTPVNMAKGNVAVKCLLAGSTGCTSEKLCNKCLVHIRKLSDLKENQIDTVISTAIRTGNTLKRRTGVENGVKRALNLRYGLDTKLEKKKKQYKVAKAQKSLLEKKLATSKAKIERLKAKVLERSNRENSI